MRKLLIVTIISSLCVAPAYAQLAVSANDNKVVNENGKNVVVPNAAPDTVSIIDLRSSPPKVIGEVQAPTSVVGPPLSVALTPDESYALVTSNQKKDPKDPAKTVPDNRVSVIDLKAMKVVQTVETGAGAAGVSINRAGTMALVANRSEGTVSVLKLAGGTVTVGEKLKLGDEKSGPSHVQFTPDGRRALVTRDGDHGLTLLTVDGDKVSVSNRTFYAGLRPYGMDIASDGRHAVVANVGLGQGDVDTASLIDLQANPPRTIDTVAVGPTPEGIKISPDGRYVAVVIHNGSTRPSDHPLYNANGKLILLGLSNNKLSKLSEASIGRWSQGAVFSPDSKLVLVQNMVEKDIQVFRVVQGQLVDTKERIKLSGGGAAIRTVEK